MTSTLSSRLLHGVVRTRERLEAVVAMDAGLPYLDHHRPGGEPLFGTVLGIEAMAQAAAELTQLPCVHSVEAVEIHAPYLPSPGAPPLRVGATCSGVGQGHSIVSCAMWSSGAAAERVHFRCRVNVGNPWSPSIGPSVRVGLTDAVAAVTATDIYSVYFHGAAYQVIADASWNGDRLLARAAPVLPAFFGTDSVRLCTAPRVTEFALQSAGLYAIALTGSMLIPHRIRSLRWSSPVADLGPGATTSVVGAGADGLVDVTVADEHGQVVLQLGGYQTVPLPYASETSAVLALQRRLVAHGPPPWPSKLT